MSAYSEFYRLAPTIRAGLLFTPNKSLLYVFSQIFVPWWYDVIATEGTNVDRNQFKPYTVT